MSEDVATTENAVETERTTKMQNPVKAGPVRERVAVRMHPDTRERVNYWAKKRELSANEYIALAVEEKIARENGDYELPTLELQRLNQMIDQVVALTTSSENLQSTVVAGFESLLGLTRGDSYLTDQEDGDLPVPSVGLGE